MTLFQLKFTDFENIILAKQISNLTLEIVMNELRRFKHSADLFANSSHIIESAENIALTY